VRRRDFIALLGSAGATWPLALRAQQPAKIPRIGIIDDAPMWHAFRQALRELGYVEGQNVAYEYRYGEGSPDRLAEVAAELVRRPVDLIATFGTPPTHAAKEATATIPIVMVGVGDPVRAGLVASLARPGGNITGNTVLSPDLGPKRMQILREAIANVSRVAFLINPDNASNGMGSGARRGPVTAPWPCVPWHSQQPFCMNTALPCSAEAACAASGAAATRAAVAAAIVNLCMTGLSAVG